MATRGVKRELIPTKHKQFVSLYLYVFLCGQLKTTEEDRRRCFGLMSDSVSVSRKLLESAGSGGDSTELKTGYIFTFAWRNEPLRCKQSTVTSCNSLIWLLNGGKCTEKRRGERKDPAGWQRETVSELMWFTIRVFYFDALPVSDFSALCSLKVLQSKIDCWLSGEDYPLRQPWLTSRSVPAKVAPRRLQFFSFAFFRVATRRLMPVIWLPSMSTPFRLAPDYRNI